MIGMPSWCVWVLLIVIAGWERVFAAEAGVNRPLQSPASPALEFGAQHSTALLLALQDGPNGQNHLREWATYIQLNNPTGLPPVWVVCPESSANFALVADVAPQFQPFVVEDNASWDTVLRNFALQQTDAAVFGLLGEGVLPPVDLVRSITSVEQALAGYATPVAVLSRSKSKDKSNSPSQWLPDTFVAQIWCNKRMMTGLDLNGETVDSSTLRAFLPNFIGAHRAKSAKAGSLVLADGTHLVPSVYDAEGGGGRQSDLSGDASVAAADGETLFIGSLKHALLPTRGGLERSAFIGTSPWPPAYVLEHVADGTGLVVVNTVTCGDLDFAVNFLRAARKASNGMKALWVATDDVAFEFMDALEPGCAALFRAPNLVMIRPQVLLHILKQGHSLLWTDSDMVWLDDPYPTFPDPRDPQSIHSWCEARKPLLRSASLTKQASRASSNFLKNNPKESKTKRSHTRDLDLYGAELMIELDEKPDNFCTCLMSMKPTRIVKHLVLNWMRWISERGVTTNQEAFQPPLHRALRAGLRMERFPQERFPSGNQFFNHTFVDNYADVYYPNVSIVHNNWIQGHTDKKERFELYRMWDVGETVFPTCE